jgi:sugar phosphate isomerase/epimerase
MFSCFHTVGLPNRSLPEAIRMIGETGYSAVELNAETLPWAPAHITPQADAAERGAVAAACKARGLVIVAVGAHTPMVMSDPAARSAALAYVNGCTDLACDIGSRYVHILSGPLDEGADREDGWAWFRSAVEQAVAYASARNVGLGVEAIVGHLFHKVDDYHRLRRELPGVPFQVNFDPSHLQAQGEDPRRVIEELGDQIAHVHLKDASGRYPKFAFPPLGEGDVDFVALVEGLRALGYAGALSVEYEAQVFGFHKDENQILRESKAFVDALG